MPRAPLGEINGNTQKRKELTPYKRGYIIAQAEGGLSPTQVARDLQISRSTVRRTLERNPQRIDGQSKPRSGRPKKLSEANICHLYIIIKRDPFLSFREIIDRSGLTFSRTTFVRILQSSGYAHWKAKKRPHLTKEHAAARYQWALAHRDWTWGEWRKVIWSDECSVELGKGKQHQWVFGPNEPGEKWKKKVYYYIP